MSQPTSDSGSAAAAAAAAGKLAVDEAGSLSPASATSPAHHTPQPDTATASGSDAGQPVKRGRRSKPKVKTGCSNCKRRRIKCDEKRPACTQCVRSNKECTGYPPPSRSARPFEEVRIAPKPMPLAPAGPVLAPAPTILQKEHLLVPRRQHIQPKDPVTPSVLSEFRPQSYSPSLTTYAPSLGLPFNQNEMLYFELFRTQTASELSGFFDRTFWTERVLQECHNGTAIQHAVIALGALYKTLEQSCELDTVDPIAHPALSESIMNHWQVAIRKYSEACQVMVMLNQRDQSSDRIRLMATVLLACFDSFIGDHKQAIVQIQTGLGFLEQLRVDMRQKRYSSPEEVVGEELVMIFTRLAIQAKSYDMAFHFPHPYVIRLSSPGQEDATSPDSYRSASHSPSSANSIPFYFSDVCEARIAADKLMERLIRFIERLYAAKEEPSNVLPESWQQYGSRHKEQLEAWFDAYEPILQGRCAPHISPIEKSAIIALHMYQVMIFILFLTLFYDTEEHFDAFLPYFKIIVDMGLEMVRDEETRATNSHCSHIGLCVHRQRAQWDSLGSPDFVACHIKPSFSADMGIVPPLFMVATKCRDPTLRRQAIQLLRSSARREGMWDSNMAAKIAEWVLLLEEPEDQPYHASPDSSPDTSPTMYVYEPAIPSIGYDMDPYQTSYNSYPEMAVSIRKTVPESRRVMIKSVDFDLRTRFANVCVGTRGLRHDLPDVRWRETRLTW